MENVRTVEAPSAPVQHLRMTYEEFLAWAGEDTQAEWVNGEVIVPMPPKDRHQDVAGFLHLLLRAFVDWLHLGKVRSAPFEMKPAPGTQSREPDIVFVARANLARLTPERLAGPAELLSFA
mgnify:CR=1 FL=1